MRQTHSLNEAMNDRRVQLRMQWQEVAEAAGLSVAGLGAIRRGERQPTAVTKGRIEDALQWDAGSIDAVLAGGEPTPANGRPEPPLAELDRDQLREALHRFRQAADDLDRLINPRP